MPKYRKKPVVIEATQWFKNGDHPEDYPKEITGFDNGLPRTWTSEEMQAGGWEGKIVRYYRHPEMSGEELCQHCRLPMHYHGWVDTMEGGHIVCPSDWIVTGVKGEHYPVKDAIFRLTYEPVTQPGAAAQERGDTT